jgi:hypothetical protein
MMLMALVSFQDVHAIDTTVRNLNYTALTPPEVDSEDSELVHFRVYVPAVEQNEAARINARYFEQLALVGGRAPEYKDTKPVFLAGSDKPVYGARNDLGCLSTCYDLLFRYYLF